MVRAYGLGTSPSNRCHLLPIIIPAKWNMLFTRYLHHGQSVESRWFLLVISGTINKLSPCCTMHEEEGKQNNPLFKIKTKIEQTYIKKCIISLNTQASPSSNFCCSDPLFITLLVSKVSLAQFLVLKMERSRMDNTFAIHSVSELVIKRHPQTGWLMIFFELKQKLITGK